MTWRDFAPAKTSRKREATEWSITYAFEAADTALPRVLLIGDSICNGYQGQVRELLKGKVGVSFWASSKCVTDPDYFRELEFILDARPVDMVTFNNGLHSLSTDRAEWDAAYAAAVSFIQYKAPRARIALVCSTPLKDPRLTAVSASLNETVRRTAAERGLPVVDLFALMDGLDREKYWRDTYHFGPDAVAMQAKAISDWVLSPAE